MDWQEWFENAGARREETVYREFFGADTGCIYPLDHDIFEPFGKGDSDPPWLTHEVLAGDAWRYVIFTVDQ